MLEVAGATPLSTGLTPSAAVGGNIFFNSLSLSNTLGGCDLDDVVPDAVV